MATVSRRVPVGRRHRRDAGPIFRRGDGSVRRETLAADGSPVFVTIENRATARFYSFSGGSWTAQPLALEHTAPPAAAEFSNLTPERGTRGGFKLVRVVAPTGAVILRAPALNYFGLVEEHADPPLRIEFHAVRQEEPPSALFEPPPGVSVAQLPWPHP